MKKINPISGLKINLVHLDDDPCELAGSIDPQEVDLDSGDELIHFRHPIRYDLLLTLFPDSLLIQGSIEAVVDMECSRCLAPFEEPFRFDGWACHIPLEGEDAAPVENDCVDLTPFIREDILLALPAHPVCGEDCPGASESMSRASESDAEVLDSEKVTGDQKSGSVWAELDQIHWDEEGESDK